MSVLCFSPFFMKGQTPETPTARVVYDPLFWRDKLKLDAEQTDRINTINYEYYGRLIAAVNKEGNDKKALQSVVYENLLIRSQSIWDTFHPKQKRRWKKLWKNKFGSTSI
jgi:hypothetical protein